jgi:nicotinamide-nucleotide amidase
MKEIGGMEMRAEIIAVGTELLLGQILNSNARFLSEELASLGIDVFFHTAVGDNRARVQEAFSTARGRSELVIFTGGLGPTDDDLTKEAVAEAMGLELILDADWQKKLASFFASIKRPMPAKNLKQALVPAGSLLLYNHNGTAPGIYIEQNGLTVILLPGPPRELNPMFREAVAPLLRDRLGTVTIQSRMVKVVGLGESAVEEQVADLVQQQNPTVAPLVHNFEVHLRITAKGDTADEAKALVDKMDGELQGRLARYIYGRDQETLSGVVGGLLREQGKSLAVAESCTGGRLGDAITDESGSSDYFWGGVTAYSNDVKEKILQVPRSTLLEHGAVSEATAKAMALGVRSLMGADFSLAVTGIAGPLGATEEKPVGLVYIALAGEGFCRCQEFFLHGKRETVKGRTVVMALNMLRRELILEKDASRGGVK